MRFKVFPRAVVLLTPRRRWALKLAAYWFGTTGALYAGCELIRLIVIYPSFYAWLSPFGLEISLIVCGLIWTSLVFIGGVRSIIGGMPKGMGSAG